MSVPRYPLIRRRRGSIASSALATQRGFWSAVRHRATVSVTGPTWAMSDSREVVVFRLTPRAWKSPSRCRVRVSSTPSSRLPTADALRRPNSVRSRSRAAWASGEVGRA